MARVIASRIIQKWLSQLQWLAEASAALKQCPGTPQPSMIEARLWCHPSSPAVQDKSMSRISLTIHRHRLRLILSLTCVNPLLCLPFGAPWLLVLPDVTAASACRQYDFTPPGAVPETALGAAPDDDTVPRPLGVSGAVAFAGCYTGHAISRGMQVRWLARCTLSQDMSASGHSQSCSCCMSTKCRQDVMEAQRRVTCRDDQRECTGKVGPSPTCSTSSSNPSRHIAHTADTTPMAACGGRISTCEKAGGRRH